ncbi:hypothetical protein LTR10_017157 [Elasticomyces elasticus]|uniref:NmrA-like domain-containing protein n=1 Tax=Exophiala sideris TaxID=1016849 RepID=A0ABR0JDQ7_9EURO|nr:hypothetical protein LTR10_017157 [Elasticomyces elasticus]KAK5032546.1 hypothetical protein LTS07_003955 [Exophiala sideris]KAK5037275.1 hypothetical protein LTR13_005081 [Exophiala sideris]KAK5062071.1 hypothetical protein LTR69_004428 [Exophiala sideris]KAK5182433.1 hypothetical protein LTR44_005445 [Eurotiomycetes sp. CCFEE 6388]
MENGSTTRPLIAVAGCTGVQGGSVIKYLLKSGLFRIRGLTRNPSSIAARKLLGAGIEVVHAELDDVESLQRAFDGCHGVYAVTNCWEHGWDAETRHGKNMVDAAKENGVKHFIWSTMEFSGDLDIWHFDSKARVNDYLIKSGLGRTSIYTAAYYENFEMQLRPKKRQDATTGRVFYEIDFNTIPADAEFFAFSGREIGAWVVQAFLHPEHYLNGDLKLVVEWLTTREMAATATKVTGRDVRPRECTELELEQTQEKGEIYVDLYRMTRYYMTHPPETGVRDQDETLRIFPQASRWEDYVREHAESIFGDSN